MANGIYRRPLLKAVSVGAAGMLQFAEQACSQAYINTNGLKASVAHIHLSIKRRIGIPARTHPNRICERLRFAYEDIPVVAPAMRAQSKWMWLRAPTVYQ
jgi:hypothetical protein